MYMYKYDGIIRERIIDYKFNEKSYLYKTFSQEIKSFDKIYNVFKNYDMAIPVPIHNKRKLERGYNQTELILKDLYMGGTCVTKNVNVLIKKINTKPQSMLDKKERGNNIKNAYAIKNAEKIMDKKILLLDDIYTTGNTVNECSRVLKQNGAKNIDVLVIAKD